MAVLKKAKIDQLAESEKETARLDFKAEFDPDVKKDWCEILKDIVAMVNTRGGLIVFGIGDDGQPSGADLTKLSKLDPAKVTDKIASYTDVQFGDIQVVTVQRGGLPYPAIVVGRSKTPIIFSNPGNYPIPGDKSRQGSAFGIGVVFVRHGAKSEPATTDDLRQFIERRIDEVGKAWRRGIRKVVKAPVDHEVHVVPPNMKLVHDNDARAVRLVNDAKAPVARFRNPDETHPFRQKELMPEIARRIGKKPYPSTHDIQCVRRVHKTDDDPNFTYTAKYGSRQYSVAFADWIVEQFKADPDFFLEKLALRSPSDESRLRRTSRDSPIN